MASSDDDQLIKNSLLFISVRENRNVDEKLENVKKYLQEGADINAADGNNNNNTPIHVAARRGEAAIVRLLIENGANLYKQNSKGETPLAIAQELNTEDKQEIVDLLQNAGRLANTPDVEMLNNVSQNNALPDVVNDLQNVAQPQTPDKAKPELPNGYQNNAKPKTANKVSRNNAQPEFKYLKRSGTSGVCGQLYETKLLSLVLMRALNDKDIELFYLGTNIRGIGDLDDICLRYHVKGQEKPTMVFVQAKHREDREKGRITVEDVRSPTGDFSLRKYFESFLTIKDRFRLNNEDVMFDGDFDSIECNLIIYTPAKDYFTKKRTENQISEKVHHLINTGEETQVFQYEHNEEDIEYLTKMTVIERLKKLGSVFLEFIMAEKEKPEMILVDKLISRYHVVMGRDVLQLSRIQKESKEHRMWQFRPDFFESDCEYLDALKKTFYKELSTKRCDYSKISNEDRENFKQILEDPCASTISKFIGKLATYNDKTKKLQLIEVTDFKKKFKPGQFEPLVERFNKIETNENVINEAIRMKLESMELKLPASFGNLDMTFRGTDIKIKRRIKTVADKLMNLFTINENTKTTEISNQIVGQGKTIEQGIIDINGGIGSAVGNLLVLDPSTKMLKFDIENETLPPNAVLFLNELKDERFKPVNEELSNYRINININGFPKDSFNGDEYDKRQAREFLNKLWFYANQAKEDEVERILKNDINKHYNTENGKNQLKFKIHSDAIFLRSHDEIQKWWMQTSEAPYLTRTSEFFERAKQAVIDNPLLTVLNFMYSLKIQNIGVKFKEDAIHALELDKTAERIFNVVTEASVFSGIKIMQHFEKQDKYSFIDFDYVLSLPLNDYNTMLKELQQKNLETLIVIYEKLKYYEGLCNKLKEIMELFEGSRIVVVTDSVLAEEIKEFVGDTYRSVRDDRTYLIDLTESSQTKILEETPILFQGDELPFKSVLVHQNARSLVRTEILYNLIYKDKIEIGHSLIDQIYKDIDHFIDRSLSDVDNTYKVETLYDISDEVVVITGRPGMGKSALLTHLSLKTKQLDPLPWIVRVNLPEHEKEFTRWQKQDLKISVPLILHFLCTIALKNIDTQMEIKLDHNNGIAFVAHAHQDIDPIALFELELFLYLYNYDQVIFLFDDFNAMCPHFETEVLEMLKHLKEEGKRMWIMTCPYKHTKAILVNEFGTSYKLDRFQAEEKKVYLERFFRTNLKLERLNYDQFENVRSFLEFMSKFTNTRLVNDPEREFLPLFSLIFHLIYVLAVKFFQSEINKPSASTIRNRVRENFEIDLDQYTPVDEILGRTPDDEELELSGTPLHLYLAANYFRFRIEDSISFLLGEQEVLNKWDLILNGVTLYQHYIEAHMKRIFQKEDTDDESVVSTFQRTRKEFLEKHKKLGLFTLCRENDLNKLLKPHEIEEIKDTIARIKAGEERSGLINCVVNEVPRFAHLVFAEYFAVECLTDMMKQVSADSKNNPLKNASLWQSLLNIVLFNAPPGVRKAFDYKLKSDGELAKLANSDECRDVVFELLLKRDKRGTAGGGEGVGEHSPVSDAIEDGLMNIVNLFLSSAQLNLNRGNVDEVFKLLGHSVEKFKEFGREYTEILNNVIDSVKDMNVGKLGDIVRSGRLTEVPLRHASSYCSSETASELQRHVVATTSQLPAFTQSVQQLFQQTDNLGQTLSTLATLGVQAVLNDIVDRLKPPDPGLD